MVGADFGVCVGVFSIAIAAEEATVAVAVAVSIFLIFAALLFAASNVGTNVVGFVMKSAHLRLQSIASSQ